MYILQFISIVGIQNTKIKGEEGKIRKEVWLAMKLIRGIFRLFLRFPLRYVSSLCPTFSYLLDLLESSGSVVAATISRIIV